MTPPGIKHHIHYVDINSLTPNDTPSTKGHNHGNIFHLFYTTSLPVITMMKFTNFTIYAGIIQGIGSSHWLSPSPKWPLLWQTHWHTHPKKCIMVKITLHCASKCPTYYYASFCSGNGLVPNRWQALSELMVTHFSDPYMYHQGSMS